MRSIRHLVVLLPAFIFSAAAAQPVLITAPATINPGDTLIGGVPIATAEITVRGTTLTVNGRHSIASLTVERSAGNQPGIITHAAGFQYDEEGAERFGMHLMVSGDVVVQGASGSLVASRIDASGRGYSSGTGPGAGMGGPSFTCAAGGGHGGAGGRSRENCNDAPGGTCHGSITQPSDMGSGGGRDNSSLGGAGGGAIRLAIGGAFQLDGSVTASGLNGGAESGGGAGGSLWIDCESLSGSGSFSANGGSADATWAGGGGGGRIAVYAAGGSTFSGIFLAAGGNGYSRGGAGTTLFKVGDARATIRIDNNGGTGVRETTEFYGATLLDADVIVRGGARLGPRREQADFELSITGDLTVETGGALYADGRGHPSGTGPGAGMGGSSFTCAAGGGHGGAGGRSRPDCNDAPGGICHGSITQPSDMGSGGGRDNQSLGGAGGGSIRLTIGGAFHHDGTATATGLNGGAESGGGAGGGLWIDCGSLSGSGSFSANGGSADATWAGGGGGGRIAVYAAGGSTFSGTFLAAGGDGYSRGGAGTALLKAGDARATVWIDNNGATDLRETTEFYGYILLDADVVVRGGARLGPRREQADFELLITGDLTVETGGALYADGRGYPSGTGPGAGMGGPSFTCAAGGGHGGAGGRSRDNCNDAPGGTCHGSITQPTDLGSGGGRDNSALGGAGGGAIRIVIGGAFHHDGTATATGLNGGAESGGGAGGGLWIDCGSLSGSGSFSANGGNADATWAGGGGGGRIAVYAAGGSTFSGTFLAAGGNGYSRGGAGTALLKNGGNRAVILIDNGGSANAQRETTELPGPTMLDADMIVRGRARLGPRREQADFELSLTGNLTIDVDGEVYADARGFPSNTGPGAGTGGSGYTCAAGGGYGGRGGNSRSNCNNAPGGPPYGDPTNPAEMGSGGGRDNSAPGGKGGGAIRITTDGAIVLDGRIGANGGSGSAESGGGSGGSVVLTCSGITGGGTITARGGSADTTWAGGGGGGRIAIFSCNNALSQEQLIVTGGAGVNNGAPGSVFAGSSSIIITQQPQGGDYRGGDFFQLVVEAAGDGPLTFQWRKRDVLGVFVDLAEGQEGIYSEVNSNTLFVSGASCAAAGDYDCYLCDACGCYPSAVATLTIEAPGDFNQDGGIDGADVEAFYAEWESGGERGDINLDGGIDGADVEFFFSRWEQGC